MTTPETPPIRIVIVDDHPLIRRGLMDLLHGQPDMLVCGEAATFSAALDVIAAQQPSVAIVDLSLQRDNGLDLVTALAASHPTVRVLVLSALDERLHAERALRAGALGYIMKDQGTRELLTAIRRVAEGRSYVSEATAERILSTLGSPRHQANAAPLDRLSDRERHVIRLIGQGLSTRQIATLMNVSIKTVESHCGHIKDKLGLSNARELTRFAVIATQALPPSGERP